MFLGSRAFSVAWPALWDSLPDDLRDSERFGQDLKTIYSMDIAGR